jgi:hypothetical protein
MDRTYTDGMGAGASERRHESSRVAPSGHVGLVSNATSRDDMSVVFCGAMFWIVGLIRPVEVSRTDKTCRGDWT